MASVVALEQLAFARRIADRAVALGVEIGAARGGRIATTHLGAAVADAVLQAGLSYRSVVWPRVERILVEFPETATLRGLAELIQERRVEEYLSWRHPTKIGRFVSLVDLLESEGLEDTCNLRHWLCCGERSRSKMLAINGVGPKTYDYLACLVGVDCIAVDRHIKAFASAAGVSANSYETLSAATAFAADFLGMSRRDFDGWIWETMRA